MILKGDSNMATKVLYFWCGYAKAGMWEGYLNGMYAVRNPHYEELVETKAIYPYTALFDGKPWDHVACLANAPCLGKQ
jgi:hypothetical protein